MNQHIFTNHEHLLGPYWLDYVAQPWSATHPVRERDASVPLSACVPLHVHVDDVRVHRGSGGHVNMTVFSWSCAVARGAFKDTKTPITWLETHKFIEGETNAQIVKFLCWVFTVLMTGKLPSTGFKGEEFRYCDANAGMDFSPPYRYYFSGLKADEKAAKEQHCANRCSQANFICMLDVCCKHVEGLCYKDMSLSAPWRSTALTHEQCMMFCREPSPWGEMPGFNMWRQLRDGLHVFFHRGLASDVSASTVLEMCKQGYFGTGVSLDAQVANAFDAFRAFASERKLPIPKAWHLRKLHFKDGSCPVFGESYKCHDVKQFMRFAAHAVSTLDCHPRSEHEEVRHVCLQSLCCFVHTSSRAGPLYTPAGLASQQRVGRDALLALQWLHYSGHLFVGVRWKCRPKCHSFDHIVSEAERGCHQNSFYHENWGEEDLMGRVRAICQSCHASTKVKRGLERSLLTLRVNGVNGVKGP